jgi:uncharacterized protein (TIGR03067 family)
MMRILTLTVVYLVASGTIGSSVAQERVRLDGTWAVTAMTVNGRLITGPLGSFTFDEGTYEQSVDGNVIGRGTFRLDQTTKPMMIDLIVVEGGPRGSVQRGIIDVAGNTMRLQLSVVAGDDRPADFTPRPQAYLIVASRK